MLSNREKVEYDIIWLEKADNKLKDFNLMSHDLQKTFIIIVYFVNSICTEKLKF